MPWPLTVKHCEWMRSNGASCEVSEDKRERGLDPLAAVRDIALEPYGIAHPPLSGHAGGHNAPKGPGLHRSQHISPRVLPVLRRFNVLPYCC
jgi:hypothetical protein